MVAGLETMDLAISSHAIASTARNILSLYAQAGVAPADIPEARIQAAEKAAHRASAERYTDKLLQLNYAISVAGIKNAEYEIRANYAAAGVILDGGLQNSIHDAVTAAHKIAAGIEVEALENTDRPRPPEVLDRIEKDIWGHYAESGKVIGAAMQARIRASVLQAHKTSADIGLKMLVSCRSAADMEKLEKEVRANYQQAGIAVDAPLDQSIRAAKTVGYQTIAESMLARLDTYPPLMEAGELQGEEKEIRTDFAAAGIPVDKNLDTHIHTALAHASRPWIPRAH